MELGEVAPSWIRAFKNSALGLPRRVSPGDTTPRPGLPLIELEPFSPLSWNLLFSILFGGVTFSILLFSALSPVRFGVLYIFSYTKTIYKTRRTKTNYLEHYWRWRTKKRGKLTRMVLLPAGKLKVRHLNASGRTIFLNFKENWVVSSCTR